MWDIFVMSYVCAKLAPPMSQIYPSPSPSLDKVGGAFCQPQLTTHNFWLFLLLWPILGQLAPCLPFEHCCLVSKEHWCLYIFLKSIEAFAYLWRALLPLYISKEHWSLCIFLKSIAAFVYFWRALLPLYISEEHCCLCIFLNSIAAFIYF